MMTTGDPHTIAFKQQMDALNDFIADMDIPHELGVAARAYLRNTRELRKKLSYDQLVARLSPGLQGTIMLHMSQSTFSKVCDLPLTFHGRPRPSMPAHDLPCPPMAFHDFHDNSIDLPHDLPWCDLP